jgi:hypothetical protein
VSEIAHTTIDSTQRSSIELPSHPLEVDEFIARHLDEEEHEADEQQRTSEAELIALDLLGASQAGRCFSDRCPAATKRAGLNRARS